jgi:protein SCO1/2
VIRQRRSSARLLLGPLLAAALCGPGCGPPDSAGDPDRSAAEQVAQHFFRGDLVYGEPEAPDFTLIDQFGRPFRLSDHRGRLVLIFFGYVQCPEVCPATLSTWSKVAKRLGEERDRVRFVFITVDPERDTPERLAKHLAIFGPDFIGLTGTPDQLGSVYRSYKTEHEKVKFFDSPAGYLVEHSSHTFLVDPGGSQRLRYDYDTRSNDVFHDVQWLLQQWPVPDRDRVADPQLPGEVG